MDVEAVKERGLTMGLKPPRARVAVGPRHGRNWRVIPACLMKPGDTWADHGQVYAMNRFDDWFTVYAGSPGRPTRVQDDAMVKVFTEVKMSYGQIDGKGVTHITATSMSRDGFERTLCGKTGQIELVADSNVEKVCSACTKAAEAQS